jgi:hypothetical protein
MSIVGRWSHDQGLYRYVPVGMTNKSLRSHPAGSSCSKTCQTSTRRYGGRNCHGSDRKEEKIQCLAIELATFGGSG